ncbi:hypothetical protein EJ08DRAFT_671585 [Tothia fuscella]|uniref:Histidine kinase n=1 Tax=Tothia fuscella TaxID=1048955 RepID=A0A9P4NN12_9PEZI|nr:hypothetical protein EJ08DRAFT_671585 [Tothia fuscella]
MLSGKRWFLVSAFPEFRPEGVMVRAWGMNVDISYQKWALNLKEERLNETMEAKRQSERFIDRLPMNCEILCQLHYSVQMKLLTTSKAAESRGVPSNLDAASVQSLIESATTIITCTQHQKRLLDDILCVSKLDASLLELSPSEVDPLVLVQHALHMHQQEFRNIGVEGTFQIEKSYHQLNIKTVLLDSGQTMQILINLVANSIKFTQFQSIRQVTVHLDASVMCPADEEGQHYLLAREIPEGRPVPSELEDAGNRYGDMVYICFAVEDTGCGLSGEEMRRLFTRFSQASPKTHSQYGGSGLGLFICKELTELQGGRIGVESVPGASSTFKFYLKAKRVQNSKLDPTFQGTEPGFYDKECRHYKRGSIGSIDISELGVPSPPIEPPARPPLVPDVLHVLVVEDNLINQKVMATQLARANCVVHVANHGLDCLNFLATTTFAQHPKPQYHPSTRKNSPPINLSIILLDLEMPVMGGLECITKIRKMQRTGELVQWVPVIAITANARTEQIKDATAQGMSLSLLLLMRLYDEVITKPFRIKELVPQMYALIDRMARRSSKSDVYLQSP